MDWFDLLAVQETLESLLQHHSLKASVLHKVTEGNEEDVLAAIIPGLWCSRVSVLAF